MIASLDHRLLSARRQRATGNGVLLATTALAAILAATAAGAQQRAKLTTTPVGPQLGRLSQSDVDDARARLDDLVVTGVITRAQADKTLGSMTVTGTNETGGTGSRSERFVEISMRDAGVDPKAIAAATTALTSSSGPVTDDGKGNFSGGTLAQRAAATKDYGHSLAVGLAASAGQAGNAALIAAYDGVVAKGGKLISQDGGGIVAQGGGNIVAQGGGNATNGIVAQGGGNVLSPEAVAATQAAMASVRSLDALGGSAADKALAKINTALAGVSTADLDKAASRKPGSYALQDTSGSVSGVLQQGAANAAAAQQAAVDAKAAADAVNLVTRDRAVLDQAIANKDQSLATQMQAKLTTDAAAAAKADRAVTGASDSGILSGALAKATADTSPDAVRARLSAPVAPTVTPAQQAAANAANATATQAAGDAASAQAALQAVQAKVGGWHPTDPAQQIALDTAMMKSAVATSQAALTKAEATLVDLRNSKAPDYAIKSQQDVIDNAYRNLATNKAMQANNYNVLVDQSNAADANAKMAKDRADTFRASLPSNAAAITPDQAKTLGALQDASRAASLVAGQADAAVNLARLQARSDAAADMSRNGPAAGVSSGAIAAMRDANSNDIPQIRSMQADIARGAVETKQAVAVADKTSGLITNAAILGVMQGAVTATQQNAAATKTAADSAKAVVAAGNTPAIVTAAAPGTPGVGGQPVGAPPAGGGRLAQGLAPAPSAPASGFNDTTVMASVRAQQSAQAFTQAGQAAQGAIKGMSDAQLQQLAGAAPKLGSIDPKQVEAISTMLANDTSGQAWALVKGQLASAKKPDGTPLNLSSADLDQIKTAAQVLGKMPPAQQDGVLGIAKSAAALPPGALGTYLTDLKAGVDPGTVGAAAGAAIAVQALQAQYGKNPTDPAQQKALDSQMAQSGLSGYKLSLAKAESDLATLQKNGAPAYMIKSAQDTVGAKYKDMAFVEGQIRNNYAGVAVDADVAAGAAKAAQGKLDSFKASLPAKPSAEQTQQLSALTADAKLAQAKSDQAGATRDLALLQARADGTADMQRNAAAAGASADSVKAAVQANSAVAGQIAQKRAVLSNDAAKVAGLTPAPVAAPDKPGAPGAFRGVDTTRLIMSVGKDKAPGAKPVAGGATGAVAAAPPSAGGAPQIKKPDVVGKVAPGVTGMVMPVMAKPTAGGATGAVAAAPPSAGGAPQLRQPDVVGKVAPGVTGTAARGIAKPAAGGATGAVAGRVAPAVTGTAVPAVVKSGGTSTAGVAASTNAPRIGQARTAEPRPKVVTATTVQPITAVAQPPRPVVQQAPRPAVAQVPRPVAVVQVPRPVAVVQVPRPVVQQAPRPVVQQAPRPAMPPAPIPVKMPVMPASPLKK